MVVSENLRRSVGKGGIFGSMGPLEQKEHARESLSYSLASRVFVAPSQMEILRHVFVQTMSNLEKLFKVLQEGDGNRGAAMRTFRFDGRARKESVEQQQLLRGLLAL